MASACRRAYKAYIKYSRPGKRGPPGSQKATGRDGGPKDATRLLLCVARGKVTGIESPSRNLNLAFSSAYRVAGEAQSEQKLQVVVATAAEFNISKPTTATGDDHA